ncbi:MAG: hypothetical protein IKN89_13995 [Oscillospiraceae bacterium]|nr:hypothetical protein [Oscillospiraceae bacterium]
MAKKIVEGLWDCPYCGQKGIGGLVKSCPNCAHPQDADTKFYLGEKKEYLDEEKAKDYGKGADWTCAFCGSLNRHGNANCANCGAQREDSSGDYFENRRKEQAAQAKPQPQPQPKKKRKIAPLIIGILAILAIIFFVTRPKDKATTVVDKTWERAIAVEALTPVQEQSWSQPPQSARNVSSRQAIRTYEKVLDHYEEEAYDVPYDVLDGYDTYTEYEDNGDGTFTEVEREEPRYRTEYRTEYRTVPVYRDEPVYDTLYEYEIDKWVPARTEKAGGSCYEPRSDLIRAGDWSVVSEPYWPDTRLGGNERESTRGEEYILYFSDAKGKSYSARVTEELWNKYSRDQSVELEVQGSRVLSIDGVRIS